jgi:hypothetical protein
MLSKKLIVAILMTMILTTLPVTSAAASESNGIPWTTYDEGFAKAEAEGKPIYMDFHALCPICGLMDIYTYNTSLILNRTNDFIYIRIEGPDQPELLEQYEIDLYPTMIFMMPDGTEMGRLKGNTSAPALSNEMDKALNIFNDKYGKPNGGDPTTDGSDSGDSSSLMDNSMFLILIIAVTVVAIVLGIVIMIMKKKKK